ncbi:MAG: response regulator [Candidatus Omnitrophota bacterium]|nr:response regulator [Candidatus Omnitrophota bacterium]
MANNIKKILIVDDDQAILTFIEKILSGANYEVIATTSGKEAVELAKNSKPDLIILDIILPDMMGGEISQILSQDSLTYAIPIIFLTGLNTKEDEQMIKKAGNYHLLAKPVFREDLLDAISRVLAEK